MADEFTLTINWDAFESVRGDLERLAAFLGPSEFPEFLRVAEDISADAEGLYRGYLGGKPTPAGKAVQHPSGATARGIKRNRTGFLAWSLSNDAPAAKALEEGTPERDMKECLPTAPRARRSKKGDLYLIIPFRHGVPTTRGLNAMPKEVYKLAVQMQFSRVLGAPSTRTSATGWEVPRWSYRWNGRLPDARKLQNLGIDEGVARRMSGMVRMSKAGHTSYMTFRVMSQASPPGSWVRPAVPGLWPLRYAVDEAMAQGRDRMEDALEADLWGALGMANSESPL